MRNKVKEIDKKPNIVLFWWYYQYKNFNPNNIKIGEKLYKNILIYYIGYVTIKDSKYVEINSVNPIYLIFNQVNGYFDEINGNKYLTLVSTSENKENKKI